MSVIAAFEVLSPRSLSFVPSAEINNYGNEKLDVLIEH